MPVFYCSDGLPHLFIAYKMKRDNELLPFAEVKVLRRSSKYENCSSKDELIVNLWQVVEEMKPKLQKKFLWFLTGSEKIPIGGSKDLSKSLRFLSSKRLFSFVLRLRHDTFCQSMRDVAFQSILFIFYSFLFFNCFILKINILYTYINVCQDNS